MSLRFETNDGKECKHRWHQHLCDCYLAVDLLDKKLFHSFNTFVVCRHEHGRKLSNDEMYERAALKIASKWRLIGTEVHEMVGDSTVYETYFRILGMVGQNQLPIPTLTHNETIPHSYMVKTLDKIRSCYKAFDMYYFNKYMDVPMDIDMYRNVWKVEYDEKGEEQCRGIPWDEPDTDDGVINYLRKFSWYNITFTGFEHEGKLHHNSYFSKSCMYPYKMDKLVAKFNKATHEVPKGLKEIAHLIPTAISMLDKYAGWDKYYGSFDWNFDKELKKNIPPFKTSSGERPGPAFETHVEKEGIHYYKKIAGTKIEQLDYCYKVLFEMKDRINSVNTPEAILDQLMKDFDMVYKIVSKEEIQLVPLGPPAIMAAGSEKASLKCREYFIPHTILIILAAVLFKAMQIMMRGMVIAIGHKKSHGGTYLLARRFRYFDKNMRYITFDITGFDTSVKSIYLKLMCSSVYKFYKFSDNRQSHLFRCFFEYYCNKFVNKTVHVFGPIWRLFFGVMPSGDFMTSHGDSWITAFAFFLFFTKKSTTNSGFRKEFNRQIKAGELNLCVYGDDNVFGFHKKLLEFFTVAELQTFLKDVFDFETRDFILHEKFCSDMRDGFIVKPRVVFLQHYFVESLELGLDGDYPLVVPMRCISTTIRKFGRKKEDGTAFDYFLASAAIVYDNPFNDKAWEFAAFVRDYFKDDKPDAAYIEEIKKRKTGSISKMLRKLNITIEDILHTFPSRTEIKHLHAVDEGKYRQDNDYGYLDELF